MPPKRKAERSFEDDEDEGFDARGSTSKKLMVEDDLDSDYEEEDDDISDEETHEEGGSITADSPNPADPNTGANSPGTSVSIEPRRKFPSEYKTIACDWPGCTLKFNRPARLAAHRRSHTNERPFKCTWDNCDKDYREEKHLRQHLLTHTKERRFKCTYVDDKGACTKDFANSSRLRRHMGTTHAGKDQFRCKDYPPCDLTFRKRNTLDRHIRTAHRGGRAYPCEEPGCDAEFDSQGALRNHTKREHSDPEFFCDECPPEVDSNGHSSRPGFPTLPQLQAHIRAEHLKCAFCDHKCRGQAELEQHIEKFHNDSPAAPTPKKIWHCEYPGCPKTFSKRSNMSQHVRNVHQGHRFTCGQVDHSSTPNMTGWSNDQGCGQDFTTKANLETHIRHVHLGHARPRQVNPNAGLRRQVTNSNLINTLTGVNRHLACTVPGCTEHFARQIDLDAHVRAHTAHLQPYEAAVVGLAQTQDSFDTGDLSHRETAPLPFQGSYQPVILRQEENMISGDNSNMGAPAAEYAPVPTTHSDQYPLQDPGFLSLGQTQYGDDWVGENQDLPNPSAAPSQPISQDPPLFNGQRRTLHRFEPVTSDSYAYLFSPGQQQQFLSYFHQTENLAQIQRANYLHGVATDLVNQGMVRERNRQPTSGTQGPNFRFINNEAVRRNNARRKRQANSSSQRASSGMYQPTARNIVRQPHFGARNTYSPPQPERSAFLPYSDSENAEMSYPPPPSYTTNPYESTESVYRPSSLNNAVTRTTLESWNQPPSAYTADPRANASGAVYQQNAYYIADPHANVPATWNQPPSAYIPGPVDPSRHAVHQGYPGEPRFSPLPYHSPAPAPQLRTPSRQNHENAPDVQMSGTMGMNTSGQGQQTPRNAARAPSSANRTPSRTPNAAEATGEAPQTPLRIHHVRLPATPTRPRLRTPPPPPDEVPPFERKSSGKTDSPRLIPAEKPVLGLDGFGNKSDWPPLPAGKALDETPDRPDDATPVEFYGVTRDGRVSFRKQYNGAGWYPVPDWAAEYRGRPLPPNTEDQGKVVSFAQASSRARAQDQATQAAGRGVEALDFSGEDRLDEIFARNLPVTQGRGFEGAGYRGEWQDRDFPAEAGTEATKTEEEKEEEEKARQEMENLRAWTNLDWDTPSPKK